MARRQPTRSIIKPVFLACEGRSELGYSRWLNRLASQVGLAVAITSEDIEGGDPLDLVQKSVSRLLRIERQRGRHRVRGLLLDADGLGHDQGRDAEAFQLAQGKQFHLIWQRPTHEVFLVRHFVGYGDHNPPDATSIWKVLGEAWPEYTKGMDAGGYGAKLTYQHLENARAVEADLDRFLNEAGWRRVHV